MFMQKINRVGETNVNKYGSKMTIIEYNNNKDITVEFENGYKIECVYNQFKIGTLTSLYDKTTYNIGYIGEGEYTVKFNNILTIQYKVWSEMLKRCYSQNFHKNNPTYINCEVCEEWLNFQVFSKWFDENYYTINDEEMCLDKDILFKGNKIYSPYTCVFVPMRINSLFTKSDSARGKYPIGIHKLPSGNFQARCNTLERRVSLGSYDTPEKAFKEGYKPFKEAYIKQVANDYKDKIPKDLYDAMINYIVEIDD